jgi:hypothetical protein
MLVLETDAGWQLIEQVEHARLSGALATAWGVGVFAPAGDALQLASDRHDEGWAVWDTHPSLAANGAPMSFLEAPVPPLLSSYSASVEALLAEDAHAGLLASLHVTGLRRGRYGLAPDSASRAQAARSGDAPHPGEDPHITTFVATEEARQQRLRGELDLAREQERHEYAQLQLFDVLSLELGLTDLSRAGHERMLDFAPTSVGAPEAPLTLRTLGGGRLAVEPWPFAPERVMLTMARRLLRPGSFADTRELRREWTDAPLEPIAIELTP